MRSTAAFVAQHNYAIFHRLFLYRIGHRDNCRSEYKSSPNLTPLPNSNVCSISTHNHTQCHHRQTNLDNDDQKAQINLFQETKYDCSDYQCYTAHPKHEHQKMTSETITKPITSFWLQKPMFPLTLM